MTPYGTAILVVAFGNRSEASGDRSTPNGIADRGTPIPVVAVVNSTMFEHIGLLIPPLGLPDASYPIPQKR